jgi:hypothetical protein
LFAALRFSLLSALRLLPSLLCFQLPPPHFLLPLLYFLLLPPRLCLPPCVLAFFRYCVFCLHCRVFNFRRRGIFCSRRCRLFRSRLRFFVPAGTAYPVASAG